MTTAVSTQSQTPKRWSRDDFLHEYNHFRTWSSDPEWIAAKLGMTVSAVERRLERYEVFIPTQEDREAQAALNALIEAGDRFTADQLPASASSSATSKAIQRAARKRLIVAVGSRPHPMHGSHPLTIWQSTYASGYEAGVELAS